MSEKYIDHGEKNTDSFEDLSSLNQEINRPTHDKNEHENKLHKAEVSRDNINSLAKHSEHVKDQALRERIEKPLSEPKWAGKELVEHKYTHTLSSIRNRLKTPEKGLSKLIHQPVVERASDLLENTVARPSGILFGGIFSFIGSLSSYLLARRLGGELRLSVFAVFFVGGFFVGLIVELAWRYFANKRSK